MAPSAVHDALRSLLPGFNIPPRLTSQAESLLSLSRQRAANLKVEEEIARSHACAEIACRRLRVGLRLPNIKSGAGAPAKPAVYQKLLGFLEGVLADGATTPSRKRAADTTVTPRSSVKRARVSAEQQTPTKNRKTDFIGRIHHATGRTPTQGDDAVPPYVMPAIRSLCAHFKTPLLVPHTYTGICLILEYSGTWPVKDGGREDKNDILSLTVAVYLMVLTRMKRGEMTSELYNTTSAECMQTLSLRTAPEVANKIEAWISKINSESWATGQDWWTSVPESVIDFPPRTAGEGEVGGREDGDADVDTDRVTVSRHDVLQKRLGEHDPADVLLQGLGTMLQDAVDWLSEDRKGLFVDWKSNIIRKIDLTSRSGRQKARKKPTKT